MLKKAPFLLSEQGWGEFDMEIVLHGVDKGGDHVVRHDLNFQKNKYESIHTIVSRLCFSLHYHSPSTNADFPAPGYRRSITRVPTL